MQLIGLTASHTVFGNGTITDFSGHVVKICFTQGEKKFIYPDAFSSFLTLEDSTTQSEINKLLGIQLQKQNDKKLLQEQEENQRRRMLTLKITPKSQAVFNLTPDQAEEALSTGFLSTGHYITGTAKGTPRIPNRLKPNSVCLITSCPKDRPETERQILGAFMVKDDFFGDLCKDGVIEGHSQRRLILDAKQLLPYQKYVDDSKTVSRWGSIMFKYIANDTMKQILSDMAQTLQGTDKEAGALEFYGYFCQMNHLSDKPAGEDSL